MVSFARDPSSALHGCFEWDDTKAAHEYRLMRARNLIVTVKFTPVGTNRPIQAFVSLKQDRSNPKGGYRELAAVMRNEGLREMFLAQALDDFRYWQEKYQALTELVPIFMAAEKVIARKATDQPKKAPRRRKRTLQVA